MSGLLLFGCASDIRKVNGPESVDNRPCATATAEALRQKLPESGLKLRADLEGEPFDAFVKWITPFLQRPIPVHTDRALVFEKDGIGLVVWLMDGCAVGHAMGPWEPIQKQLGLPV